MGAAALSMGAMAGCSSSGPDPDDAARVLAKALSARDVSKVPMDTSAANAQKAMTRIVQALGDVKPAVSVAGVSQKDNRATVTLSVKWKIERTTWAYKTKAKLVLTDDRWTVAWAPSVVAPGLTTSERLAVKTTPADRGDILGADDEALVTERPVKRVGIDKTRAKADTIDSSATALARLLDIDVDSYRKRVAAAGAQAFVEGLVLREGPDYPISEADLRAIPGAVALGAELPLAPARSFGQPLLGSVGDATAEDIKDSKNALRAGDQVGLSGLQKRFDPDLRGEPGIAVSAVIDGDGEGVAPRTLYVSEPKTGKPLRTTLDVSLQGAADDILANVKPASAIVAIRPSTGNIVALSSGPGGKGNDTASVGRYAPGSTFKVVTALAFLRSGLTQQSRVSCPDTLTVDGRRFKNYSDYPASAVGDITLRTAIANSCNTAMIATRGKASQSGLVAAATALGLGQDLDLGIPAFLGSVPTKASGTERAASVIGQGRIEASPLAMAVVAASLANGRRVTPVLLPDSKVASVPTAAAPLTGTEATQVEDMMRAVVTEGSGRFLTDLSGGPVAAKTGTAEYGNDAPPRTHAWMIAMHGDLAVAVFVDDGESGSQTAGPLLESFLRKAGWG
ncbi:MAG: penicillin-binding protein, partial [Flavobacterium sp.]|nr:penicillin-binding protein [Aeromicrobium sp.]